jgi:hypothetical protein
MEGRVEHRSKVEVRSYPSRQQETDCQIDQGAHIEMAAPVEGRRMVPACSVQVQVATVFGQEEVQDQRRQWEGLKETWEVSLLMTPQVPTQAQIYMLHAQCFRLPQTLSCTSVKKSWRCLHLQAHLVCQTCCQCVHAKMQAVPRPTLP